MLILNLHVQPRAHTTGYVGRHGERIKIRLKAPPVDGVANQALREWLASEFDVPAAAVRLLAGGAGRAKRLAIVHPRRFPSWISESTA